MSVSDEAVEAAAKGLAQHKWPTAMGVWDSFGQGMQDDFRDQVRAALSAALPVLLSHERIARAIRDDDWPDYDDQIHHPIKDYMSNAHAVIDALGIT